MKKICVLLLLIFTITGCSINEPKNAGNILEFKSTITYPGNAREQLKESNNKIKAGDINAAIDDLEALTRQYPDLTVAHYNLGIAYSLNNDLEKAITSWNKVISLDNNYANAYYNLGLAYKMLNNNKEAISNFTAYLLLKPGDFLAPSIKDEIIKLTEPTIGKGVIGRVLISDETDNNLIINNKSFFNNTVPQIYTSIETTNVPANTKFQSVWLYTMKNKQKIPINTANYKISGTNNILLTLNKPETNWPYGKYELHIIVNNVTNVILPFSIIK